MVRATGHGTVVIGSYGALDTVSLGAGEKVMIDSGHVVAFPETVEWNLQRATGGTLGALKSGEGFVFEFTGPGDVITQTRNQRQLFNIINNEIGGRE